MPSSGEGKRQSSRRLRSQVQLEEDWRPAADFIFPGSPSPKRSDKTNKMKSPVNRKLRRQTMMPPRRGAAAADVTSPPLSQRRTRRQSMMPVKLRENVLSSPKKAASPPSPAPKARSKRRLTPDIEIVAVVEKPTGGKKSRVIPTSKSSIEVKTGPPSSSSSSSPKPSAAKKHKSLLSLPAKSRASRSTAKITEKPASPKRKKTDQSPARKRALSPSQSKPSSPARKRPAQAQAASPKKRAASRSRSMPRLERTKSLPRGQKRGAKVPDKKTSSTPSPKKAVTPKKKAPSSPAKPAPKAKTPKASLKASASPRTPKSGKKSTASLKTKRKATTPAKTPPRNKKKTTTTLAKTPPRNKKTMTTTPKSSPVKGAVAIKTPQSLTTMKIPETPPSTGERNQVRTPKIVLKKIKSPSALASQKHNATATPSPRRNKLTRSAAKTRILSSSKSARHVQLKVEGKSPPPSLASFRKTPSSKKVAADSNLKDLGASPVLPSAHQQLQRIRETIASAKKTRNTPPRQTTTTTTTTTTATPTKVVTKADIHASGNGKCGLGSSLDNHYESWQSSTPTARAPLPSTPRSTRGTTTSVSRFSHRVSSSSVSVQHRAAPKSSTPIKGSSKLDVVQGRKESHDLTQSEEEECDAVDEGRADSSAGGEVSVDSEGGESSLEESMEEEEGEESKVEVGSTTQSSRKNYCTLM